MGLNLFNTTVNKTTFNSMFEGCSTKLGKIYIFFKFFLGKIDQTILINHALIYCLKKFSINCSSLIDCRAVNEVSI